LATEVFPGLRIALLHGRMRPKEKDRVMESFRAGEAHLLISTTVIEVGVDVPNATVMLVENAERFGLAQLHQLRGRIGRSGHPSWCVLFDESSPENEEARGRIEAVAKTSDGFELADEDLRLRGEGTLFDIRQSGMPDLRRAAPGTPEGLLREALDGAEPAPARGGASGSRPGGGRLTPSDPEEAGGLTMRCLRITLILALGLLVAPLVAGRRRRGRCTGSGISARSRWTPRPRMGGLSCWASGSTATSRDITCTSNAGSPRERRNAYPPSLLSWSASG